MPGLIACRSLVARRTSALTRSHQAIRLVDGRSARLFALPLTSSACVMLQALTRNGVMSPSSWALVQVGPSMTKPATEKRSLFTTPNHSSCTGPQCSQHWHRNLAPNIAPRRRGTWITAGRLLSRVFRRCGLECGCTKVSVRDNHSNRCVSSNPRQHPAYP